MWTKYASETALKIDEKETCMKASWPRLTLHNFRMEPDNTAECDQEVSGIVGHDDDEDEHKTDKSIRKTEPEIERASQVPKRVFFDSYLSYT